MRPGDYILALTIPQKGDVTSNWNLEAITNKESSATILMGLIQRILCPVDYSDAGHLGLDMAIEWARRTQAELLVLHVIPPYLPQSMDFALLVPPDAPVEIQRREDAETYLQKFVEEYVPREITVRSVVLMGSPASEIVELARQEGADLVIMSTHGYAGWRHLVMGSVAEGVVRTSSCPVLTVGPNCKRAEMTKAAATPGESPSP